MALVLTRLVRSNYDELDNIPVIHQDLTTSFTKQADTYYIHTGSTTSAYTKGRMYYCDGTNLKKVVIVDELNDGTLTITVNGTAHTFTANQSGNTSFSITDTTYTAGTGLSLLNGVFSVKTGYSTNGKNYKVATDTNGNLYVNVPWTDTNTDTHYTNYLQIKGNNTEAVKFTQNADKTLNFKSGNNVSISVASGEITISATDTDTGATSIGTSGTGNGLAGASYDSSTRKITFTMGKFLVNHQSIKKLNTNNTVSYDVNPNESITGEGTINLHKIAKTGLYNDLINKPSNATQSTAGLMSAADKEKLDGIATGATKNTFSYDSSTKILTIS